MQFTQEEIFFFNSMTKGRMPFEIVCKLPEQKTSEEIVEETIQSCMQKGLIGEDRHLTKTGLVMLHSWEQYRNSRWHVKMNELRIALLPNNKLIIAYPKDGGYDIQCLRSELVMFALLKQSEYLRQGEERPQRGKWRSISEEEWEQEIEEMEGAIPLFLYENRKRIERKVYYWKNEQGYVFNMDRKRVRELSPCVMRKQIYRTLQGGESYE